jgi:C-terminal processing protease CtpA/Prc
LLTPGARFGQPEELNWSGIDFLLKNARVTVVNVGANCAGASAGIQPGDRLIEANGKPASEWSLFEIRRLFMEQKTVRARFHRPEQESHGAEEFTVSFENPKVTISSQGIVPTGGTNDSKR